MIKYSRGTQNQLEQKRTWFAPIIVSLIVILKSMDNAILVISVEHVALKLIREWTKGNQGLEK